MNRPGELSASEQRAFDAIEAGAVRDDPELDERLRDGLPRARSGRRIHGDGTVRRRRPQRAHKRGRYRQ
jgi:hypothetical protein